MSDPTASERRRAPRRHVSEPITLIVDSGRSRIASGTFALDLSQLGARVRSQLHLEPGQTITVVPREGPAAGIPSKVVWVSEGAGGTEAGLAFLEPLLDPA